MGRMLTHSQEEEQNELCYLETVSFSSCSVQFDACASEEIPSERRQTPQIETSRGLARCSRQYGSKPAPPGANLIAVRHPGNG